MKRFVGEFIDGFGNLLTDRPTRDILGLISDVHSTEHNINKMANLTSREFQAPSRRLQMEYESLSNTYPKSFTISNKSQWCVRIQRQSTVYQFTFHVSGRYPTDPPSIELLLENNYQRLIPKPVIVVNYVPAMTMLRIIEAALPLVASYRLDDLFKLPELRIEVPPLIHGVNDSVLEERNVERSSNIRGQPCYQEPPTFAIFFNFKADRIELIANNKAMGYLISQTKKFGIPNVGNSCFTNAVLQMLFNRRLIRYLLMSEVGSERRLQALAHLFEELEISDSLFRVQETIGGVEDGFRRKREQRDAYQFLQSLLVTISEKSMFNNAMRELIEVQYKEYSVCIDCGNRSEENRSQTVMDLNGVERFWTLDEALKAKNKGQCHFCKSEALIWNQYTTAPQYLFIHPNWRSPSSRPYQLGSSFHTQSIQYAYDTKLNTAKQNPQPSVNQFRFNTLSLMEKDDYVLVGLISHSGSTGSGHYFYFDKEREGKQQWIQFNDSSVFGVPQPHDRPIVAVYEKVEASKSVNLTSIQIQLVMRKLEILQRKSTRLNNSIQQTYQQGSVTNPQQPRQENTSLTSLTQQNPTYPTSNMSDISNSHDGNFKHNSFHPNNEDNDPRKSQGSMIRSPSSQIKQ